MGVCRITLCLLMERLLSEQIFGKHSVTTCEALYLQDRVLRYVIIAASYSAHVV